MIRYDLVLRAYDELMAEGRIIPTVVEADFEAQKSLITRRAAYYLNLYADSNWGLLSKTSGNNHMGLSVDIVVHRDGRYADIATDIPDINGKRKAVPIDGAIKMDAALASRWVQPTRTLAEFPEYNDIPIPHSDVPVEQPPVEETGNDAILKVLEEMFRSIVQEEIGKIKFPDYDATINLGRILGTARVTLTPKK